MLLIKIILNLIIHHHHHHHHHHHLGPMCKFHLPSPAAEVFHSEAALSVSLEVRAALCQRGLRGSRQGLWPWWTGGLGSWLLTVFGYFGPHVDIYRYKYQYDINDTYLYIYIYLFIYLFIYLYVFIYIYVYADRCIFMYIYIYLNIYIWIQYSYPTDLLTRVARARHSWCKGGALG